MIQSQRREKIKSKLLQDKSVSVSVLAASMNVSGETIRRDLEALSAEGFCKKTFGGAVLCTRSTTIVPQTVKKSLFTAEKQQIAKIAAQSVRPNDCIFLDHSTTVCAMCEEIKDMPLTVVTNSVSVLQELNGCAGITVVLTGGQLGAAEQGLFGQETLKFLNTHFFDKAFFSCRGIHMQQCTFDSTEQIAALHQALLNRSAEHFLLVDHTKFGICGFTNMTSSFTELQNLITDRPLDEQWQALLNEAHVRYRWSFSQPVL